MNRKAKVTALFLCLVFMFELLVPVSFAEDETQRTLRSGNITVTGAFPRSATLDAEEIEDPFSDVTHELDPWWWLPWHWFSGQSVKRAKRSAAAGDREEEKPDAFSALAYYDISVKVRGEETHPEGPVTITISDVDVPTDKSLQILHVLDDEDAIERAYSSRKAAEIRQEAFVEAFPEAAEAAFRATGHKNVIFVEYFTTSDGSLKIVNGSTVSFVSESFSVFILTETALEATIDASDGNTYQVTVTYDVRANIATDAYLDVREITEESPEYGEYFSESAKKLRFNEENVTYLRMFDISIVSSTTREHYQPTFPVRVNISLLDRAQNAPALGVVHFGETTELIDSTSENGVVSFVADSFSVYSLGEGEHRDAYKFYIPTDATQTTYEEYKIYNDQGETTFTQIVKEGETLTVPRLPSIAGSENSTFDAWYIGTGGPTSGVTLSETPFDFKNIPDQTDSEYHLFARFANFAYVIFHEQYNGGTDTWPITGTRRGELVGGTTKVHISDLTVSYDDPEAQQVNPGEEPPPPAMAFRGWTTEDHINPDQTIDFNVPLVGDSNGDITISENIELYPVFSRINWITFKSAPTGSGATYFPPEFLYSDEGISDISSNLPVRAGYTFAGWYTAETGGVQVTDASGSLNTSASFPADSGLSIENGKLMLSKNVTVYGHWTPAPAKYVIVIWRQCVTDDKNAADADKTYDFAESIVVNSVSEATATVAQIYKQRSGGEYTGFHYSSCDPDSIVKGNGSTVLNVYYDRDLRAIVFNSTYNGTFTGAGNAYVPTTSDDGTQYGYVNGAYVQLTHSDGFYSLDGGQTQYTGTYYCETTSNNNITEYGVVNGAVVQLTRAGSTYNRYWTYNGQRYDGTRYVRNTTTNASDTTRYAFDTASGEMLPLTQYSWTYGGSVYTGTRYTVVSNALCWTGLYGQTLAQAGYSWDTVNEYRWRENANGGTTQTLLDSFIHADPVYNLYCQGSSGTATIYHYRQQLDGTYTLEDRETAHGSNGTFYFSDKFNGFEVTAYSSASEGFRASGGHHSVTSEDSVSYSNTLHVYHRRKTYTLTYLDSYDSQYAFGSESNSSRTVLYDEPLTEFRPTATPTPKEEGTEFAGWYYDVSCTVPVDFSKTMPAANMAIYAKWDQKWHLIRIDPNGGQLYGNGDYSTWFWKAYGTTEAVIEYTNTKRDYIASLNGTWYYAVKDRAYYGLNNEWNDVEDSITERTTYYTEDISDPAIVDLNVKYEYVRDAYRYAQWYEVHPDGSETLYNFSTRIDHDLLLRLHWKQVGTYLIRYDAGDQGHLDSNDNNEDTFRLLDSSDYADRSDVIVTRTAIAEDEMHCNFIGWRIRGDNSGAIYYPGQAFEFESRFAETETIDGKEKKVLTLDAVYTVIGTAKIIYDANGGVVDSASLDYGEPTDPTAPLPLTTCTSSSATISNLINNSDVRLSSGDGFTRANAVIVGWNTEPDASGTHFDLDGEYSVDVNEPVRLYAEWGVKVYFDKNNENADWGGTWDPEKYTWDAEKQQYYTSAVIGRPVSEPIYIPVSSVSTELFKYWTLERTSLDPVEYDFSLPVAGEMTIYGFWQLPIEIPVHTADVTTAVPVNMDASWLLTNPSSVQINALTPVNLNASYASGYVDPDAGYMFAFVCLCETLEEVPTAKHVTRIYYNSTERALWADFEDGTNGRVNGSDQIWFNYFISPKTVNIRYKVMNQDGTLSDADMGRTGYPTTAVLGTYAMNETSHVDRPMYWANNSDYKFYTYAIGTPDATSSAQMRVITAASDSDANGSRPALSAQDQWDGFKYSQDGGVTWNECGREIDLYVIYYTSAAKPVIVTISEQTRGLQEDLAKYFDYTYTVTETTTNYTRTDTFTRSGTYGNYRYTLESEGTPEIVGTPVTSDVISGDTFELKNGESIPKTLFYESTAPAPVGSNYTSIGGGRYTRTYTYSETTQTITVTQSPKEDFTTTNDASASTPYVYTYTTAPDSTNQHVTFTNTREPLSVEVHVGLIIGGQYVLYDDTLRKTGSENYTFGMTYGSTETLTQTTPVDPFAGDPDNYAFIGVIYGTRNGTAITASGSADSICYDLLPGRDYADLYLNGDDSYLLGNSEIYYIYYLKPRIVYMREQGDGALTMINPIRYSTQTVTLNGVLVDQNNGLNVSDVDFIISNSDPSGYRVPPALDGTSILSLDYVKIGAGDANVTRTADLGAVSDGKELYLRIVDGTAKFSTDGVTYTDFTGEPVVYVIYRDRTDNMLKIVREDGAAEQDFWYTVNCPDGTVLYVCLPAGVSSVSIKGVPYGDYTVVEQTEWSWRYESEITQNTRVYNAHETRPEGTMVGYSEVHFSGSVDNTDWLNGYDSEVNDYGT